MPKDVERETDKTLGQQDIGLARIIGDVRYNLLEISIVLRHDYQVVRDLKLARAIPGGLFEESHV